MFSVVIPLFNKEEFIKKTIETVLNQSFQDFEIIVVDDGSTDQSLKIAESMSDPRIRIFTKENGGVSTARNYGIEKAKSQHIAFLDADDFWEKDYLKEMNQLIKDYPSCGMYSSAYKVVFSNSSDVCCTDFDRGIVTNYFKKAISNGITWTSATIIDKKVYAHVGGFPVGMVSGQDSYMWTKIAKEYKVAFTPSVLAKYNRIHSGYDLRKGKVDTCSESWYDFYDPEHFFLNEHIAKKGLLVAMRYAFSLHTEESKELAEKFSYTKLSRRRLYALKLILFTSPWGVHLLKALYKIYLSLGRFIKSRTQRNELNQNNSL
ncbi:MAG: glycosyltransferase family 2 protein [Balneola sp.]